MMVIQCPCTDVGENRKWLVPVTVSTASSPEDAVHKFVLNTEEETVTVDGVKPDDWLKVILFTDMVAMSHAWDRMYYFACASVTAERNQRMPEKDPVGLC